MQKVFSETRGTGILSQLAGIATTALIVAAPFPYACTRPEPLRLLTIGLHCLGFLWMLALLVEQRRPSIRIMPLTVAAALIAYIWLRFLMGDPPEISPFTQEHFARTYARWPESMIIRAPLGIASLWSGLVFILLVVADLSREENWQKTFAGALIAGGVGVVGVGLWQNYTHSPGIYGEIAVKSMPSPFFGPFYHFTSAGAFINLTWPLAASLALGAGLRYGVDGSGQKTLGMFWAAPAAFILVGHTAHVSRFPQVIAAVMIVLLVVLHWPARSLRIPRTTFMGMIGIGAFVSVGAIWIAAHAGRIETITSRWKMLRLMPDQSVPATPMPPPEMWPQLMRDDLFIPVDHSDYFLQDRGAAYLVAFHCILARPFFGFGPGGWMAAASQHSLDPQLRTFFHYLQFTHEDYLQTLVEWGAVGGLLCGFLIAGALWRAGRRIRSNRANDTGLSSTQLILIGAFTALCAVLIQSLIDFPLQIPANALYASALCGICWSAESSSPRQPNRSS